MPMQHNSNQLAPQPDDNETFNQNKMDLNELADDDFFGNDDGDGGDHQDNDDLAERDRRAKGKELHTSAYLEAYDAAKEERLQEGFEVGYRETVDLAKRIGEELGKQMAASKLSKRNTYQTTREAANQSATRVFGFLKNFELQTGDEYILDNLNKLEHELRVKTIKKA
jgi:flagellar biosynthesis/type III secretory pathway protein FliH